MRWVMRREEMRGWVEWREGRMGMCGSVGIDQSVQGRTGRTVRTGWDRPTLDQTFTISYPGNSYVKKKLPEPIHTWSDRWKG